MCSYDILGSTLNLPFLVRSFKVLGAVDEPRGIGFGLILELANFGSLFDLLRDSSLEVPWEERLQVLQDVAQGVQALHAHRPMPIVHSDLKSMNVLLFDSGDGSKVAKVGIYGH